jgi:hypothetical protein
VNTRSLGQNGEQASTLLISLLTGGIIGTTIAGFLVLTQAHDASMFRSQSWNSVIPVTEAGIEEGMELINKYAGTSNSGSAWTNNAGGDGWAALPSNVYYRRRYLGSNYCDIYITNQNNQPSIQSIGTVQNGSVSAGTGSPDAKRVVVVTTTPIAGPFFGAILTKNGITLSGGVVIDSFDSQDPAYSTNGSYDPAKYKDNGDIGTVQTGTTSAISGIFGVHVYGHVATGPNSTIGSAWNTEWGSKAWVNGNNQGVQAGWSRSDMNVVIPDTPPAGFSGVTFGKLSTPMQIGGNYYDYYLAPGNYQVSSLSLQSGDALYIGGKVNLRVTGDYSVGGYGYAYIPPGASLTCWVGGTASIGGSGTINGTGYATNCTFYGENTCTNFTLSANSAFTGTIYAPQADFTLAGSYAGQLFVGAVIASSAYIYGGYAFHYDESLAGGGGGGYYVASWKELSAAALSP